MPKDLKSEKKKKERIKKVFQNSISVTASAAVVVVATPLFDNVDAAFTELKLLEDSIYYELEVVENVSEEATPNAYPLRLIIENQWERIEVDLDYGMTGNVIEDLRPNAQYTFTVEMDKGLTWVTLLNERVQTESELAGVIGLTRYEDNAQRSIELDVFTQSGGIPISFYFLELYEDDLLIETIDIIEGDQVVNTSLNIKNSTYDWVLKGVSETGQLYELDTKTFIPEAVFNYEFDIFLISLDEVIVQNTWESSDLNPIYTLEIMKDGQVIQEDTLTGVDELLSLETSTEYSFSIYLTYSDDRLMETFKKRIYTKSIETMDDIFFIVNEIIQSDGTLYLVNLENFDDQFESVKIQIRNARTKRVTFERDMRRISDRFSTSLFEYRIDDYLDRDEELVISVIIKDTEIYIPIYTITP